MIWSITQIAEAISEVQESRAVYGSFQLALWDQQLSIGVGRDSTGKQVLVLPADSQVAAFDKKFASFSPMVNAEVKGEETVSGMYSILECKFDVSNANEAKTLAGVFAGLLEVNETFGTAGLSIWAMKRIFEHGLLAPDPQNLTGLIGELSVIAASPVKTLMVEAWHNINDSVYDFSMHNKRVEVKTTKSAQRHHHFSSNQLPGPSMASVSIASVNLMVTEIGQTLNDLYSNVINGLPLPLVEKVSRLVIDTIGVPASAVSEPIFDLEGTIGSVLFFDALDIPQPQYPVGVLSVEWKADLSGLQSINSNFLEDSKS
jgi:hypothetical protein